LANVLKYGALPLAFDVSEVNNVSATLGGEQLHAGIVAGLVGLALVVLYCFLYYRGLGIVVVASLVIGAVITYTAMVLLGSSVGFALNLPGIAGAIVAIGVTADSFVIYFERIRDEVRDGRSLRTAVETGWRRARHTILIADGVSMLSALVLFILAIGSVKGFAFTLGLTTLIDVFIVFFFTKPVMTLLARTRFYGGGHRLSGLDPGHLGVKALPGTRSRRPAAAGSRV
jgi:preprotein translocase subunit SecD